jgi:hypothetical protein
MSKSGDSFIRDCIRESALDDIESWDTLKKDVASWAAQEGRPFSEDEFNIELRSLAHAGMMHVYVFDTVTQQFRAVAWTKDAEVPFSELWFKTKRT